ncbi:flagellar basal-body MS-ring/collar protein FliF [Aminobacter anthyllidis]|uniref:flagellar basal-body MS-ring/collar protein FliF n=1 Tax=Aminobacter anthyllidis TaxID=1035067 RepID=UPI002456A1B4|nr:flagellar basal-body MS-ring/collar protein FliF [Aminobacter anthyllidis]MDH4988237.1 flagellar basal-body MS-ring/collar protein FliF [Aminobacter anthyllidis]
MPEQLQSIVANLRSFGPRRLAMLGGIAALVIAIVGVASVYLNRPAYETLYVGLERSDVNQIGMVLGEAGIGFDVASDGTTVLVPAGSTAQARMLLAEKGLPTSANAGYELFDNVGSLGLTSFMQQVTRVRALEGEIARTIQSISGIKAARVHIVMSERANFRRDEQKPSASVVIRAASTDADKSAMSIRHLVAAAVPGLDAERVTVLDSSGNLLASGDDPSNSSAARSIGVERTVETQIEDNIRRALAAYLGPDNFRASVKADVNTDSRQTEETIFDPESRVERSVQVVRANENSNQKQSSTPATVEQNLPDAEATATDGPQSTSESDRKEEITNYEMNSKRIATVSNGYSVTKMSIAVVVNQQRLAAILGKDATPEAIAARVADIQKMVTSATGFDEKRGDLINVSAVEFIDGLDGEVIESPGMFASIGQHAGTLINAAAFIVVVFLVAFFGLRPMAAALSGSSAAAPSLPAFAGPSFEEMQRALPNADGMASFEEEPVALSDHRPHAMDDLRNKLRPAPQDRLARMVDINEERTALILRKWAGNEVAA